MGGEGGGSEATPPRMNYLVERAIAVACSSLFLCVFARFLKQLRHSQRIQLSDLTELQETRRLIRVTLP